MRRSSATVMSLLLAGCASLSPAAKAIRISSKSETKSCTFLSVVYGAGISPQSDALENAARLKATHIVTLFEQEGKYTADAFDCKPRPSPTALAREEPVVITPAKAIEAAAEKPKNSMVRPGWVIAVMEVEDRGAASQDALSTSLIRNLGDQLRVFMAEKGLRTIDRGQQENALHDQISKAKKESYENCYASACQIELGKALAASHILRAEITHFGKSCVLNAELIDLRAEVTVAAASSRGTCAEEGFLEMSERVVRTLASGS
jgi:hypothetical protein